MKGYTTRETCRVCGSPDLTPLFSLGVQYVNDFPATPSACEEGPSAPIDLERCNDCTLVQLKHTAPQEILYSRFYWYRSGITDTMRRALRDITSTIESMIPFKSGDVVLDIGSNDGTLLRSYRSPDLRLVGVEPADNLVLDGSIGVQLIHDFWSERVYRACIDKQARVITAIGMFYDLEDPNEFISDIARVLDKDGLFVAQLMCLQNMINLGDVGNFAHEHLEFYSFESLNYLFSKHGLKIIDVQTNDVNGQSYRVFAVHNDNDSLRPLPGASDRIDDVQNNERSLSVLSTYKEFYDRMECNKRKVVDFIMEQRGYGKRIWVYGASTKGNVILQYYGLRYPIIGGAADRSKEKWERYTVGTCIPIYSEDAARLANPDFFLVLPYTFIDEFVERESEWIKRGGKFIVPLPEFRVIP